jgi:predicted nucleotidyltransferase
LTAGDLLAAVTAAVAEGRISVIGAVARNAWAPPRATSDVDFSLAAERDTLDAVEQVLQRAGYKCSRRQQVEATDSVPDLVSYRSEGAEPRQVDLLMAKTEFEAQALSRAVRVDVGAFLPVVSREDLIVYKLIADRQRDRDDVRAVIETAERGGVSLDWAHVERWANAWGIRERLDRIRPR